MGDGKKEIQKSEREYLDSLRRSAIAFRNIKKNSKLSQQDIKWVRAKGGLKIDFKKKILNNKIKSNIKKNEILQKKFFLKFDEIYDNRFI